MTATTTTVEELWTEHHGEVVRYLHKSCSDPELAADLAAETFLAASQSLSRGGKVSAGWLMTVSRRRLIDHWRRTTRQTDLLRRLQRIAADNYGIDPALMIAGDVAHALTSLCQTQRRALTLRYVEDRTVQEVADDLDVSYRAAESLLARGRRSLASAVAEYQPSIVA